MAPVMKPHIESGETIKVAIYGQTGASVEMGARNEARGLLF
jgi:hypothetical protein